MSRDKIIVGGFALLAAVSAIGFAVMFSRLGPESCMDGPGGVGSCPVLADVNGLRYTAGVASQYPGLEADLSAFSPITRTNAPNNFAELVTYRVGDIDPTLVLAAPALPVYPEDVGSYRLLFGSNSDAAFPALCDYFTDEAKFADERCGAPA